MLERVREAMPSPAMQRVFGDMCSSLCEAYRLEEEASTREGELMHREGELRAALKKDP
jgi:hypothetical protein